VSPPADFEGVSLEEKFFAERNRQLLKELRKKQEHAERRGALRNALSINDDAVLDHLLGLGIGPETALALTLVPLIAVAWADQRMEAPERKAIVQAAEESGIKSGTPAHQMLETWLARPIPDDVVAAWRRVVVSLWPQLDDNERAQLRARTVGQARKVAEAAGGILALTSKISNAEKRVLDDLGAALA